MKSFRCYKVLHSLAMKKSLITLLGLVAACLAGSFNEKLLPINENVEIAQRISRCLKEATAALFAPTNDVSIIVPSRTHYPDLVQEILKETFADKVVKIFTKLPTEPKNRCHYLVRESSFVLIDNEVNLRKRMEHSFVNRWSEYIIVTEARILWLSEFADYLWNLGFVRVAFVRVKLNGSSTLIRLIRNPLLRESAPSLKAFDLCDEDPTSTSVLPVKMRHVTITVYPFSSILQTPTNGTLKLVRVLEGTQSANDFNTILADGTQSNFGIAVLKMFATKYNIELMICKWEDQETLTWMNARDRCSDGECDFFYSRELAPVEDCCQDVDSIAWYKYETLVFVDSLKSSLHPLRGLILPYSGVVWLCIAALFGVFALFAHAIEILWTQSLVRERITILQIWAIFVGQGLPVQPVKFSLRFVLGMWILYSLNSNLLYTARFSSCLTAIDHNNILNSFQDILDSGRPICGNNKTKFLLSDTKSPLIRSLHDRLELVDARDVIDKIFHENYIGARHSRYVIEHNWANRANDSLRLYIPFEAVIVNYPSFYFAKKRHPYSKDFSKMVSDARETGLLIYVAEKNHVKLGKTKAERPLVTTDELFLGMKHLRIMFIILFICHFTSGLIFIVELYMTRRIVARRSPRK